MYIMYVISNNKILGKQKLRRFKLERPRSYKNHEVNKFTVNYEITRRLRSLLECQLRVISYLLNLN